MSDPTVSIYIVPPVLPENLHDRIATLACENRTVERLQVMGYKHAGSVVLADRQAYLELEIARLEKLLGKNPHTRPVKKVELHRAVL